MSKAISFLIVFGGLLGTSFMSSCRGAEPPSLVQVTAQPSITNIQQLGVNIGAWAYYSAPGGYFRNIVQNPGFEPSESGRVVAVPSQGLTQTTFCDSVNYLSYPSGFYKNAEFQDVYVTGSMKTARALVRGIGTITDYNPTGCRGNIPQFGYNAPFAIHGGDYVYFHQTGNLNPGLQSPGYPPAGWWNNDPQWTLAHDQEPAGDGVQALGLPLDGRQHSIYQFFDSCGHCYTTSSGRTQNFVLINGEWTLSLWAKCGACSEDASISIEFARNNQGTTFLSRRVVPTRNWVKFTFAFTGNESVLTSGVNTLQLTISGSGHKGHLEVDDVFVGPLSEAASPWTSQMVSVLNRLHPGYIRSWQSDIGNSYANFIADDAARGETPSYAAGPGRLGWTYSLDSFFELAKSVRAIPWITIPTVLSDAELANLGQYIAAEDNKYRFAAILFEFGDELWNGGSCLGACYSFSGDSYTAIAARALDIIKKAAGDRIPIKTVASAQYGAYPPGGNIGTVAPVAEALGMSYVDMAPYYWFCDNSGKGTAGLLADFLGDQNIQLPDIEAIFAKVKGGVQPAGYESGPSTWWGTMTNSERNTIVAGAASASADGELALNWWNAGSPILAAWNLAQTNLASATPSSAPGLCDSSDSPPNGMEVYIWGLVHDFYTPLVRPRGLAMELLNKYFIATKTGSFHRTEVIGYRGIVAGAWEDMAHGYGWNVAIVNTQPDSQHIVIQLPSNRELPRGRVWQINYKRTITDDNEECENVGKSCNPFVSIGRGASIAKGPGVTEITVLVPPYGFVVGQASLPSQHQE